MPLVVRKSHVDSMAIIQKQLFSTCALRRSSVSRPLSCITFREAEHSIEMSDSVSQLLPNPKLEVSSTIGGDFLLGKRVIAYVGEGTEVPSTDS